MRVGGLYVKSSEFSYASGSHSYSTTTDPLQALDLNSDEKHAGFIERCMRHSAPNVKFESYKITVEEILD